MNSRGIDGEEIQDIGVTMTNARRRSNSSSYAAGLKDFKTKDPKSFTQKNFVAEVEQKKEEMEEKASASGRPAFARGSVGPQYEWHFKDTAVLQDCLKLVFAYLDHRQLHYSLQERRSVEKFLRAFVPVLCMQLSPISRCFKKQERTKVLQAGLSLGSESSTHVCL